MLRFYGVPILASPVLSFPLSDERKSGFLPPSFGIDSRSGFQAAIPYYWNIAPNRDATFTLHREHAPRAVARQPSSATSSPAYFGEVELPLLPNDRATPTARAMRSASDHEGAAGRTTPTSRLRRAARLRRRLLEGLPRRDEEPHAAAAADRPAAVDRPFGDWSTYARALRWQVLQTEDPTTRIDSPPYERRRRSARATPRPWRGGFDVGFEAEFNRFANPDDRFLATRQTGDAHARARQHRPAVRSPGWT